MERSAMTVFLPRRTRKFMEDVRNKTLFSPHFSEQNNLSRNGSPRPKNDLIYLIFLEVAMSKWG